MIEKNNAALEFIQLIAYQARLEGREIPTISTDFETALFIRKMICDGMGGADMVAPSNMEVVVKYDGVKICVDKSQYIHKPKPPSGDRHIEITIRYPVIT